MQKRKKVAHNRPQTGHLFIAQVEKDSRGSQTCLIHSREVCIISQISPALQVCKWPKKNPTININSRVMN